MGKNVWKFDFNTGHALAGRDAYGNPYPVKWSKLNLGAIIQQGDIGDRGEQGLFETLGFKLYNMAGVPGSNTLPVQFRIVENARLTTAPRPTSTTTTSRACTSRSSRTTAASSIPTGCRTGTSTRWSRARARRRVLDNQGPTQPSDNSDLVAFQSMLTQIGSTASASNEAWLRANVNLDEYFAFRAITKGIHNFDIGFGKNYFSTELISARPRRSNSSLMTSRSRRCSRSTRVKASR